MPMVFAVFDRERSGLRRRRGRAGSGSRKGLFSSPVAVHDCIIEETEEAERRCCAMGVGIRGGASFISGCLSIRSRLGLRRPMFANGPKALSRKVCGGSLDARFLGTFEAETSRMPRSRAGVVDRATGAAACSPPNNPFTLKNEVTFSLTDLLSPAIGVATGLDDRVEPTKAMAFSFIDGFIPAFLNNGVPLPLFLLFARFPQKTIKNAIRVTPKTAAIAPPIAPTSTFFSPAWVSPGVCVLPSACGALGSCVDIAPSEFFPPTTEVPLIVFGNAGVTVKDVSDPPFPVVTTTVGCGRTTPPDVIIAGNGPKPVPDGLAIGEFPA